MAFSPDGRAFVTDAVDRTVRVIGLTRGNTAPVITHRHGHMTPNTVTGACSAARFNATDTDGDPLIYSVTAQPSAGGTVTLDNVTGTFSYVPSVAARDLAARTPNQDFTTFTVTATDREAATAIPVTVEIAPAQSAPQIPVTTTQITVGSHPIDVTVAGNRLYVINTGDGSVSVIDTTTNQVVNTIPALGSPVADGGIRRRSISVPQPVRLLQRHRLSEGGRHRPPEPSWPPSPCPSVKSSAGPTRLESQI